MIAWLAEADEDRIFLSVTSFAEIRHGIELLQDGRRRDRPGQWFTEELPVRFEGRILPIDQRVADAWGVWTARLRKAGRPPASMDAFFAATAETYRLTLVTRNVKDYAAAGIPSFNPWDPHSRNS